MKKRKLNPKLIVSFLLSLFLVLMFQNCGPQDLQQNSLNPNGSTNESPSANQSAQEPQLRCLALPISTLKVVLKNTSLSSLTQVKLGDQVLHDTCSTVPNSHLRLDQNGAIILDHLLSDLIVEENHPTLHPDSLTISVDEDCDGQAEASETFTGVDFTTQISENTVCGTTALNLQVKLEL